MQRLQHVDQVAYVRFASVYKEFRDVAEFMHEISALEKKPSKRENPAGGARPPGALAPQHLPISQSAPPQD